MKVGFIYAGSWEHAYPQIRESFDEQVWCRSDDFIMKYPRAVLPHGAEPVLLYLSASARTAADFRHTAGFRLRRVPVRWGAGHHDRELSFRILAEIDRERFDLLHIYNYYRHRRRPDMYDLLAWHCRRHRRPFVAHYQGGEFPKADPRSRLKQWLLEPRRRLKKRTMEWADRIFCIGHAEIERLTNPNHPDYYGLPFDRSRFRHVPNIVDTSVFSPGGRAAACAALDLDPARRYLLYVGYLRPGKGVAHLLRVMPMLLPRHPDLHLLLAGGGAEEQNLRHLAARLNLAAHVTFAGAVPHEKLAAYYQSADVLVLPSYAEGGIPAVVLEALACNVPCVVTAVGDMAGLQNDGVGLVTPPGDEPALAAALERMAGRAFVMDPDGRRRRLAQHSYPPVGELIWTEYQDVLAAAARRRQHGRRTP
jgi:glycosyltransferase involved in cell wall biosynthesis